MRFAELLAIIVTVLALEIVAGAAYRPVAEMLPEAGPDESRMDQSTFLFEVPITSAVNCCSWPAAKVTFCGLILSLIRAAEAGAANAPASPTRFNSTIADASMALEFISFSLWSGILLYGESTQATFPISTVRRTSFGTSESCFRVFSLRCR